MLDATGNRSSELGLIRREKGWRRGDCRGSLSSGLILLSFYISLEWYTGTSEIDINESFS
jgi:hypothetical protein